MVFTCRFGRITLLAAVAPSAAACAPMSYNVRAPAPSGLKYEAVAQKQQTDISLIDKRDEKDRVFSSDVLPATLAIDGAPIDAPQFLAHHLQQELASRGLPMQVSGTDKGSPRIGLSAFRVRNHRVSGFSPFVTFTFMSADVETSAGVQRVGVFVKAGKVPVWSFDEVIEPTFNQPLSIAVKEFASKVATQLYDYRASDSAVSELAAKLSQPRTPVSYLDVYLLGFTNNPKALETVVGLLDDSDEYIRLAAISSLGTLRATSQFERLKTIYRNEGGLWQDRAMALKSIGDLGTAEAKAFMQEEQKRWSAAPSSREATWNLEILRLYL